MKKFSMILVLALCLTGLSFAKETTLKANKVSAETVLSILDADFAANVEVDEDGDIFIAYEGLWFYIFINQDATYLEFYSSWKPAGAVSNNTANRITNSWNSEHTFAKAYYSSDDNRFRLTYDLAYDGGLNSTNFDISLKVFVGLCDRFWDVLLDEGVLL